MHRFSFTAIETDGRMTEGVIEAADRAAAAEALSRAGRTPLELSEAGANRASGGRPGARLPEARLARTLRGLGVLLRAGAPLDRAMAIQARQTAGTDGRVLSEMLNEVKAGSSLSQAMSGRVPALVVGLTEAGEAGGALATALLRTADLVEERIRLRQKLRASLTYPAVVLLLTLGAVLFLAFAVLPQFETLFGSFRQDLPTGTAIFLAAGRWVREGWWIAALLLAAALIGTRAAVRTPAGRQSLDRLVLRLPGLGAALLALDTARFGRTLALLLTAGAPMLNALDLAIRTVENRSVSEGLRDGAETVRQGGRLADALAAAGVLAPATVDMIRVGEESGALTEMLNHVADLSQKDAEMRLARLVEGLTPFLTLLLGGLVAALMASIISAVFSINAIAM